MRWVRQKFMIIEHIRKWWVAVIGSCDHVPEWRVEARDCSAVCARSSAAERAACAAATADCAAVVDAAWACAVECERE
jgi:hypothetical protein